MQDVCKFTFWEAFSTEIPRKVVYAFYISLLTEPCRCLTAHIFEFLYDCFNFVSTLKHRPSTSVSFIFCGNEHSNPSVTWVLRWVDKQGAICVFLSLIIVFGIFISCPSVSLNNVENWKLVLTRWSICSHMQYLYASVLFIYVILSNIFGVNV